MCKVFIRFYGELNDYLPLNFKQRSFANALRPLTTVRELLETCAVPYDDVDLILVNGKPVEFDLQLQSDDQISIYPIFRSVDIAPLNLINQGHTH